MLNDDQLLRYSRHILLPQLDVGGQAALLASRVMIVGLGGLGSPVALYLAAAGVGHLLLVDDDAVDVSNLQRQIIHGQASLGQNKAQSAAAQIQALNPGVTTRVIAQRLSDEALFEQVAQVDVLVDCSDNFATRQALNLASQRQIKPLISGAAIRWEGQISVFDPRQNQSPCYACLYPDTQEEGLTCSQSGVASPLVGVIGSYQALETIKVIAGAGKPLVGRLQLFDGLNGSWREFKLNKDPHCRVCSQTHSV